MRGRKRLRKKGVHIQPLMRLGFARSFGIPMSDGLRLFTPPHFQTVRISNVPPSTRIADDRIRGWGGSGMILNWVVEGAIEEDAPPSN